MSRPYFNTVIGKGTINEAGDISPRYDLAYDQDHLRLADRPGWRTLVAADLNWIDAHAALVAHGLTARQADEALYLSLLNGESMFL